MQPSLSCTQPLCSCTQPSRSPHVAAQHCTLFLHPAPTHHPPLCFTHHHDPHTAAKQQQCSPRSALTPLHTALTPQCSREAARSPHTASAPLPHISRPVLQLQLRDKRFFGGEEQAGVGQGWDRVAGRVGQGGRVGIGPWFTGLVSKRKDWYGLVGRNVYVLAELKT